MKVTLTQIMKLVYEQPTNENYDSPSYGRISIAQDDLVDNIIDWLRELNIEVEEL